MSQVLSFIGTLIDGTTGGITWAIGWIAWIINKIPFGWVTVGSIVGVGFFGWHLYASLVIHMERWESGQLTGFGRFMALWGAVIFYPLDFAMAVMAMAYYGRALDVTNREFLLTQFTQRILDTETGWRFRRAVKLGRQLNQIHDTHITIPTASEKVEAMVNAKVDEAISNEESN